MYIRLCIAHAQENNRFYPHGRYVRPRVLEIKGNRGPTVRQRTLHLALHQVLAGKLCYTFIYIHAWNHYKLSVLFPVMGFLVTRALERILFLDLGLAVTEINTKKVQKQENKKQHKM